MATVSRTPLYTQEQSRPQHLPKLLERGAPKDAARIMLGKMLLT